MTVELDLEQRQEVNGLPGRSHGGREIMSERALCSESTCPACVSRRLAARE